MSAPTQKPPEKNQKLKPIAVKVGNVTVKIYRVKTRDYESFQVADFTSGKRKLISFASEQEARDEATKIAVKVATLDAGFLKLSGQDQASYVRAMELIKPMGIPLELVAAQAAEMHKLMGGRSPLIAVDYFVKRNPVTPPQRTVKEVYKELWKAKEADGASPVYVKDIKFRLGKFAEFFNCQIADVSTAQLNEWLRSRKCGARGRNNYRLAIGTLFKFASSQDYVLKDQVDMERVARAREEQTEIEIFSEEEMKKLLIAAECDPATLKAGFNLRYATGPGLMPLLLLGGFAGLRTAEIERQVWQDINLERGFIRVTAAKGNTAQKRLVPISANLKTWLAKFRKESGPVCEIARTPDAIRRLADRAGVKWKHNALRHSFISYRVAETQNMPQVSLEAGNSVKMINKHYRELVTPDEAKTWFGITPKVVAKFKAKQAAEMAKKTVKMPEKVAA